MQKPVDELFSTWREHSEDLEDVAHTHFTNLKLNDWCDVAAESRRLYCLAHELIEESGVEDACIASAAAAGYHAAVRAMSVMLGLDESALYFVLTEWMERPRDTPISASDLPALVAKERAWWDERAAKTASA
jgi:hypothetical protein